MKKLFYFLMFMLLCSAEAYSQGFKITSTVTSRDGNLSVIGATVLVKGYNVVAITDVDGKYVLDNVPEDATTIVVSCIGYTTREVAINGASVIDIVLETDQIHLDEVVVTGYGNISKASYTGSASVLNTDKIKGLPVVSVGQLLESSVPGLTLSASSV